MSEMPVSTSMKEVPQSTLFPEERYSVLAVCEQDNSYECLIH